MPFAGETPETPQCDTFHTDLRLGAVWHRARRIRMLSVFYRRASSCCRRIDASTRSYVRPATRYRKWMASDAHFGDALDMRQVTRQTAFHQQKLPWFVTQRGAR